MDLVGLQRVRVARDRADLRLGPRAAVLAGGTWLYSEPQPDLDELVDLTALDWPPLERLDDGGLRISATCPIATLAAVDPDPAWGDGAAAVFASAADALLMSWKVQRAATVGGNVCLALPAGAMISLTAGLDGEALVWQPDDGERRVPVVELVTGVRATTLHPGEVLRAIELPSAALAARIGFRRAALAPLGRSGAVVLARRDVGGAFVVTVTASTARPHRCWFPGIPTRDELAAAIDADVDAGDGWYDDAHGAPDWRRAVTLHLAEELRRVLAVAPGAATEEGA